MTTLTARLQARQQSVTAAALDRYWQLVAACATGQEIDDDHADAVLSAAGKKATDLEAAVVVYRRRTVLAAEVARGPEAKARLTEVNAQRAEIRERRAAALREFAAALAPLDQEAMTLEAVIDRADRDAPRELAAGCPYPDRREAVAAAQRAVEKCREEARDVRRKAAEWAALAARNQAGDGWTTTPGGLAAAERCRGEADKLLAAAADLDARARGELAEAVKAAEARLLEP